LSGANSRCVITIGSAIAARSTMGNGAARLLAESPVRIDRWAPPPSSPRHGNCLRTEASRRQLGRGIVFLADRTQYLERACGGAVTSGAVIEMLGVGMRCRLGVKWQSLVSVVGGAVEGATRAVAAGSCRR
jgi:hypothetical protein